MRCVECDKEATYDVPNDYCDEHWARWWCGYIDPIDGPPLPKEVQANQLKETLADIKARYGEGGG